jgi:transposase
MTELEAAYQRIAELEAELAAVKKENEMLRAELAETKHLLKLLTNHIFGKKSEQTPPEWIQDFLLKNDDDGTSAEAPPAKETKPKGGSKPGRKVRAALLPENLPVEEIILVPDEVKFAPAAYRHIGDDIVERLEATPRRVFRQRIIRQKFVQIEQPYAAPITAPVPMDVLPGSFFGPKLIIEFALGKYLYHLPLYRQAQALKHEHDITLPLATLCDTMGRLADALAPVHRAMAAQMWASGYVQIDLTPVRCLSGEREGGSFLGQMWVAAQVGGDVIYNWDETKEALVAERIIPSDFTGLLQCDGGSEVECYLEGGIRRVKPPPKERILRLGCWAHVRRKFLQAAKDGCHHAKWIFKRINLLYRIERLAREQAMDAPSRQALRQKRSDRVLRRIKARLDKLQREGVLLPRSPVMQAVNYALGQWESLQHYVMHGVAEIDNNCVENAIRPCAVGKKNWLFIGNVAAGQRAAILYSILGSCLRRDLNPRAYLTWLFERLPTATNQTIAQLTPAAYAEFLVKESTPAANSIPEPKVA